MHLLAGRKFTGKRFEAAVEKLVKATSIYLEMGFLPGSFHFSSLKDAAESLYLSSCFADPSQGTWLAPFLLLAHRQVRKRR